MWNGKGIIVHTHVVNDVIFIKDNNGSSYYYYNSQWYINNASLPFSVSAVMLEKQYIDKDNYYVQFSFCCKWLNDF